MNKTSFSTYDIKQIFEYAYNSEKWDIIEVNQYQETTKEVSIQDFIKLTLFDYKLDLKQENFFEEDEAFNFPNLDNWLNSNGDTSRTYGLVEIINKNLTASIDIDMGSIASRITFIINQDKAEALESHIDKIRSAYLGKVFDYYNNENKLISMYISLGTLVYESQPIITPLGKTIIVSLDFTIAYISGADTYNNADIMLSLDGNAFYKVPMVKVSPNYTFTGKTNISQERPYRSGVINSSVVKSVVMSFWANKNDFITTQIIHNVKIMNADYYTTTIPNEIQTNLANNSTEYNSNIPLYFSEKDEYYLGTELISQWVINKMNITSLSIDIKNSDFISVTLTLTQYGKGV